MRVEAIRLATRAERRGPDLADAGSRERDERPSPQIEVVAAVDRPYDVAERRSGRRTDVGADVVMARPDARSHECGQMIGVAHRLDGAFDDPAEQSPPAGVDGPDAATGGVGEEDRRAVGGQDDQSGAGPVGPQRVRVGDDAGR
jgi:hypothetical protein